ncbi:tRNA (adenosine(37)-N6)-threonylcarbamoyltransferase complex ATPase subunit type 1 TsaE [Candidatus Peregrinibacteria bacterium]|nr:tRNA (adenosine(37)-N6)-threonylcarbamoyltransferase complex ATPase subunit type 1 TsaE [Candidatus Peregrinibacteria bacterium]
MAETLQLWLPQAKSTQLAGASLAKTLYAFPVDLFLTGELGIGKTYFTQALAKALGVADLPTSPTYALEQRYQTTSGREFIHLDLYRLEKRHLPEVLAASEHHAGIRVIEWADKIPEAKRRGHPHIDLHFEEKGQGRTLDLTFDDFRLPTRKQILAWRKEVLLPEHIGRHCDAVGAFALRLAEVLMKQSMIVRKDALARASEVHDLLRFIDFKPGAGPLDSKLAPEQDRVFSSYRTRYPAMRHEAACAAFLREQGFPELAEIVAVHGLTLPSPERTTTEQKLLFYADKRLMIDRLVTLNQRFDDFRTRYASSSEVNRSTIWYDEAVTVERDLFPHGVPF